MYAGLATVVSNSQAVTGLPLTSSFFSVLGGNLLGVPFSVWVVVVAGIVLTVVFRRTPFGARVRAIGSNQTAARFSGIRVNRTRLQVLVLVGALAAWPESSASPTRRALTRHWAPALNCR